MPLVDLRGLDVELFGEAQAVDAVDHVDERQDRLDLVPLEVADHVPADLLRDGGAGFAVHLAALEELVELAGRCASDLHAALAEVADAQLKDLADLLRGGGLGDGDQRHLAGLALRLGGGGGDAVPDLIQLLSQAAFVWPRASSFTDTPGSLRAGIIRIARPQV